MEMKIFRAGFPIIENGIVSSLLQRPTTPGQGQGFVYNGYHIEVGRKTKGIYRHVKL